MTDIIIYHNPACGTSRNTLALIRNSGVEPHVVEYLKTLLVLALYFRRDIPAAYEPAKLRLPASAIRDRATFRTGWIVLALLLMGFFVLDPLGVPISAVAAIGACVLLVVAARGKVIETRKVLCGAPWQVVIFSLGMYLVVYGLRNAGLTDHVAALLDRATVGGVWGAAFGAGIIAAVLSSVMNNMPTVLVGALSIDASHATGVVREAKIYSKGTSSTRLRYSQSSRPAPGLPLRCGRLWITSQHRSARRLEQHCGRQDP